MLNLLTGIRNKIIGSALSSDVSDRIYLDKYPAENPIVYPYIIFFVVSDVPEKTYTEDFENIIIQFSLFSSADGVSEISDMYDDLKALFDECALTITGSAHIWMKRSNLTTMVEEITTTSGTFGVKHWAVDYEIMTSLS